MIERIHFLYPANNQIHLNPNLLDTDPHIVEKFEGRLHLTFP